jgi:predicted DNA-binding ribbon-helix-helix protein
MKLYFKLTIFVLENADTMGERMERIGRMDTDFLRCVCLEFVKNQKKTVSIRSIRSPIVSQNHPM